MRRLCTGVFFCDCKASVEVVGEDGVVSGVLVLILVLVLFVSGLLCDLLVSSFLGWSGVARIVLLVLASFSSLFSMRPAPQLRRQRDASVDVGTKSTPCSAVRDPPKAHATLQWGCLLRTCLHMADQLC